MTTNKHSERKSSKPAWQRPGGPKKGPQKQRTHPGHARPSHPDHVLIYGLHAVSAALANPSRQTKALTLTENAARRIGETLATPLPDYETVLPKKLDHLLGADTVHQGALLETTELLEPSWTEIIEGAKKGPILILDQITDPHNVGAILRSAAVFGASSLIMTRRHSPPLDATLAKSASGALELVPILRVQNLARTIARLNESEIDVLGLDGTSDNAIEDETLRPPVALVLGAEGKGLRQLTAQSCTRLCRITAAGTLTSLNVSNAAAVALHLTAMRRTTLAAKG